MNDLQSIKQRFGIIGSSPLMNRALDIAVQVAATDLSVLITGESGVGKEFFPKIIHSLSPRKHASYVAINCGAIPEGTIDSELFGHEKGSFTDAREARKGYFEEANGGTIFLDEVAELPLSTQVRLLRVLETGEFLKVGSSKVLKTNVRVTAATNVNIPEAIRKGKFREDLYYRLNTIAIKVPPLRERKEDIELLFRKFSFDVSERYKIPPLKLNSQAKEYLINYPWKGNIRELKNVSEQITILEKEREIGIDRLKYFLPEKQNQDLPVIFGNTESSGISERDLLYKVLFDMQRDIQDLKKLIAGIMDHEDYEPERRESREEVTILSKPTNTSLQLNKPHFSSVSSPVSMEEDTPIIEIESSNLSINHLEKELISKALKKYQGNRRKAAEELGFSERTIYRKIKEYNLPS